MSRLLELVPWYWRLLALAGFAAALWGHGYMHGLRHEEQKFDVYKAKVEAIGDEARRQSLERKATQDKTTKEIARDHADEVSRIRAYYARRLQLSARSGAVPATAERPVVADAPADEPRACGESPQRDVAFERACALDAEQVMKLQDFFQRNGFPVER